jgi:lysophospholipase L1-like esterase
MKKALIIVSVIVVPLLYGFMHSLALAASTKVVKVAIGDSITQRGWAKYSDYENRGIASATIADWLRWDEFADCHEGCVVMLGTNDIAYRTVEKLIAEYPKVIEKTKGACYVQVTPFSGNRVNLNTKVDTFNAWLKKQGVKTVNAFYDMPVRTYSDSTHFTEAGYKQIAKNIEKGCK